jgi:hypothetical protein
MMNAILICTSKDGYRFFVKFKNVSQHALLWLMLLWGSEEETFMDVTVFLFCAVWGYCAGGERSKREEY